jgi:type II secretory pathway pseudopilin PulG
MPANIYFSGRSRRAFSLIEVVAAVGIFAFVVVALMGLLLPNTKAVDERIDGDVARRLAENIQSELQRYSRVLAEAQKGTVRKGFDDLENAFIVGGVVRRSLFMVATKDGSRVLVTGEDPFQAWNDTYNSPYDPANAGYYGRVDIANELAAENDLQTHATPGNPLGIAFRDRYYLIEIFLPKSPAYSETDVAGNTALGFLPVSVRVVWPYRLPDGPANPTTASDYNSYGELPWLVVAPARHSILNFNLTITP